MDFRHLLEQAQNLERALGELNETLKAHIVRASAGGDAVQVAVNGAGDVVGLQLEPELLAEEPDLVAQAILSALNQATTAARTFREAERAKLTGGLRLPEI